MKYLSRKRGSSWYFLACEYKISPVEFKRGNASGLVHVEVLAAMGILAVISVVLFSSLHYSIRQGQRVERLWYADEGIKWVRSNAEALPGLRGTGELVLVKWNNGKGPGWEWRTGRNMPISVTNNSLHRFNVEWDAPESGGKRAVRLLDERRGEGHVLAGWTHIPHE